MLKENSKFIARIQRLGDFVIVVLAFFLAYHGRASLVFWNKKFNLGLPFQGKDLASFSEYSLVLIISVVACLFFLHILNAYSSLRLTTIFELLKTFSMMAGMLFLTLASAAFILKLDLSRSFIGLFCIVLVLLLILERILVIETLRYWRKRGYNFRTVLICGIGQQSQRIIKEILKRNELGIKIKAVADIGMESPENVEKFSNKLKSFGLSSNINLSGLSQTKEFLKNSQLDELIFTDCVDYMQQIRELAQIAAIRGVRTTMVADLFSIGLLKSGLSYFAAIPLIHFQTPPGDRWELALKRLLDIIISSIALIILLPVFLLIAILIKLDSSGPVFFVQTRLGLNARRFKLFKFRSMVYGAERKQKEFSGLNEMQGPAFKLTHDPRVTRIGKFLRRYSLDELLQLWNVLKGDMSLVGPRPPVPSEVNEYEDYYRRRLSMRPGMTCTWQISGRNEIKDFKSWIKLDLDYIDNWSFFKDIVLLIKTIPAVIKGTGAR